MSAKELGKDEGGKPNFREAPDYCKEPLSPRCFNCAYLDAGNLDFKCSKFNVATSVYGVCDDWKPCLQREGGNVRVFLAPEREIEVIVDTADRKPFLLVSKKKH